MALRTSGVQIPAKERNIYISNSNYFETWLLKTADYLMTKYRGTMVYHGTGLHPGMVHYNTNNQMNNQMNNLSLGDACQFKYNLPAVEVIKL